MSLKNKPTKKQKKINQFLEDLTALAKQYKFSLPKVFRILRDHLI
jgi:Mor family transcriptional regulator